MNPSVETVWHEHTCWLMDCSPHFPLASVRAICASLNNRRVDSREVAGGPLLLFTGSSFSRHGYNSRRLMPSSFASSTMWSHCVSRSTAICRKALGNVPMRFFATCHPPRCAKCANRLCLNLGGQSTQTFNFCEVGWIAKRRSIEDRRAVSLKLSRKGEALVRRITP